MSDDINRLQLISTVERLERMDEEAKGIKDDRKQVLEEAKEKGMDPKMVNYIVAQRKLDPEKRRIDRANRELYERAADLD